MFWTALPPAPRRETPRVFLKKKPGRHQPKKEVAQRWPPDVAWGQGGGGVPEENQRTAHGGDQAVHGLTASSGPPWPPLGPPLVLGVDRTSGKWWIGGIGTG